MEVLIVCLTGRARRGEFLEAALRSPTLSERNLQTQQAEGQDTEGNGSLWLHMKRTEKKEERK